ncbi:MAG: glycosyltransferase family 39 protein [Desulfobacterales bacterium]|nr:glycosyltransferase family 39 protein [Desulfobacterales bacterium]
MKDAKSYVQYANNLVDYSTFSKSSGNSSPEPDSFWAPGYPAFLAASIIAAKNLGINSYILVMSSQVVLGVLISVLTLLIGRLFLSKAWSILAAVLVSFSPHMISLGGYLLTETLFSFLLLAAIYSFSIAYIDRKWSAFIVSGLFFGLSYLVNPVIFFAPILLVLVSGYLFASSKSELSVSIKLKLISCLIVFFVIAGAWSVRNKISVKSGQLSGSNRLFINLVIGSHSNFYDIWRTNNRDPENPATKDSKVLKGSYSGFIKLLLERAIQHPGHYAKWYLIDKPILLWSWNILIGQGDIFVYPVKVSIYDKSRIALATYFTMRSIHYWLFGFAVVGIIFLFKGTSAIPHTPIFLYITLIYISAVYVVTQSEPRYSIPMRPEMYLCAVFFISKIFEYLKFIKEQNISRHQYPDESIR